MSKILSEKQKEVLMQARKNGNAYDLMQARKNGMHQDLADIIKKSKDMEDVEVKTHLLPTDNLHEGWEVTNKLFRGNSDADIITRAKTASVFAKLLEKGLDPDSLKAAVDEVTNAD